MFKNFLENLTYFGLLGLLISATPALAQPASNAPMAQDDIASFVRLYGNENPPAVAAGVDLNRQSVVVRRVSAIYILKGQLDDEAALLAKLAALGEASAVTRAEYDLYMANESLIRPVCEKYLGTYTVPVSDSKTEFPAAHFQAPQIQPAAASDDQADGPELPAATGLDPAEPTAEAAGGPIPAQGTATAPEEAPADHAPDVATAAESAVAETDAQQAGQEADTGDETSGTPIGTAAQPVGTAPEATSQPAIGDDPDASGCGDTTRPCRTTEM